MNNDPDTTVDTCAACGQPRDGKDLLHRCPNCTWPTGVCPPRWCGPCRKRCPHDNGEFVQENRARNGVMFFTRRCNICQENLGHAPHRHIAAGVYAITPGKDNVTGEACGHCGRAEDGVEQHHYAPRGLFADADDWPVGPLCRPCHQLWHRTMNAAAQRGGAA